MRARSAAGAGLHDMLEPSKPGHSRNDRFLRTFAGWIGKRGMVREPAYYVGSESPHAHRCEVATDDGSWTARNVEIKAKIAEIASFDSILVAINLVLGRA